jgi:hypothetical protein
MAEIEDKIQDQVISIISNNEVVIAKSNEEYNNNEFESLVDMLECKRSEKDYDWMSDNFLPELPSILLTDASDWANEYFSTRSFVEVALEGDNPDDKKKCDAAKKLINKTLNNREIFHYHKYIRGRLINSLRGNHWVICWWEKKRKNEIIGYDTIEKNLDVDIHGNALVNPMVQIPQTSTEQVPKIDNSIVYDRFNYEVLDPRNVFTDFKYAYSAQHKDWVTIRSEKTYPELLSSREENGYFNLDKVKELLPKNETQTSQDTYNKIEKKTPIEKTPLAYLDVYERYGTFWCNVVEDDEDGRPIVIEPGFDNFGNIIDDAELVESIITWVEYGGSKILIRFQPTPFVDSRGNSYKPIIRGWCYIHPTKDVGLSDGKYGRELQVAINDTFNMSNDRVKLATLPTLQATRNTLMDNDTLYFEPEHIMEVEHIGDLQEFKLEPDIQGALTQISMLRTGLQQVTAKFPTTQGELPSNTQTATAVQQTGNRASLRNNYKSLTDEYTFRIEFYWMIIQMAYQFMEKETAQKVFGQLIQFFDPDMDYTYSPVTGAIEQEESKNRKLQIIDQFIGRVGSIPNPNTPKLLNYLLMKAFELFGDEFPEFKNYLLDENAPPPQDGGDGSQAAPNATKNMSDTPTSNQEGIPMGSGEMEARSGMMQGGSVG